MIIFKHLMVGLFALVTFVAGSVSIDYLKKEADSASSEQNQEKRLNGSHERMLDAIEAGDIDEIKALLNKHNYHLSEKERSEDNKRFQKGLCSHWDVELFKQLLPRILITFLWTCFANPFYYLSPFSNIFKLHLPAIWEGLVLHDALFYVLGGEEKCGVTGTVDSLKQWAKRMWVWIFWSNVFYTAYITHRDVRTPSYLMRILKSKKVKDAEKEELKKIIFRKIGEKAAGSGIFVERHEKKKEFTDTINHYISSSVDPGLKKLRGGDWFELWVAKGLLFTLPKTLFDYSGLTLTRVYIPKDDSIKESIDVYKDNVNITRDTFFDETDEGTKQNSLKTLKTLWHFVYAIFLSKWPIINNKALHENS